MWFLLKIAASRGCFLIRQNGRLKGNLLEKRKRISGLATFLRNVSRHVNVRSYRKSVRGPKKPPPHRKRCKAGIHVSTHRLLQQRKQRC